MIFDLGSMVCVEDILDNEGVKPEMFTDLLNDVGLGQPGDVDPGYGGRVNLVLLYEKRLMFASSTLFLPTWMNVPGGSPAFLDCGKLYLAITQTSFQPIPSGQ